MKILNVSSMQPKAINTVNNQPVTTPVTTKPMPSDSVSFSGKKEDNVCNYFGLLKDCDNFDNPQYITNHFEAKARVNKNEEMVLDKFIWKTKDKKIGFFGSELDFAQALQNKQIKTTNFDAISNEKFSIISYDNDGVHYNLKYNKNSHELVSASASIIKETPKDAIERIAIKPSNNDKGKYIAHYQFIDDKGGERAVEDTYVLFDDNLQAKASHTEKYFQYSDGEKEEQKFACKYDEEGMPESAETKELSPYIW